MLGRVNLGTSGINVLWVIDNWIFDVLTNNNIIQQIFDDIYFFFTCIFVINDLFLDMYSSCVKLYLAFFVTFFLILILFKIYKILLYSWNIFKIWNINFANQNKHKSYILKYKLNIILNKKNEKLLQKYYLI